MRTSARLRTMLALATAGALLTACGDQGASDADDARPAGGERTASAPPATAAPTTTEPDDAADAEGPRHTEVPADFPLAAGLPGTNGDDGSPVTVTDRPTWTSIELCGETVWSADVPVARTDLAGASYSGEAEDSRSRVLALYADERAAQTALDALRDAYVACPAAEEGGTDQVYELYQAEHGGVTITHRYRSEGRFDTGLEVIELVTVGNALYLSSYYGEGGGSDETIASSVEFAHDGSRPVVEAMSVFDAPRTVPGGAAEGLGAFDLTAGWPTRAESDLEGPEYPVDSFTATFADYACDAPEPTASSDGFVRAQFSNVEDYRTRELHVFDDADGAVAWVGALRDFYDACPTRTEDGLAYPITVLDAGHGGQSFGVIRSTTYDGEPAIGLSALLVVRVGRSVLVESTSGEGIAPDPAVDGPRVLDAIAATAAPVIDAQCGFTDAGC